MARQFLVALLVVLLFDATIVGAVDALTQCKSGCNAGVRTALINQQTFANISACGGSFIGYVGGPDAQRLCAPQWHVCTFQDQLITKQLKFDYVSDPDNVPGCYQFAAAHDFDTCRPCTGNIHEDDMAGVGADCPSLGAGKGSCISGGRIDVCCSGYLSSLGCQFKVNVTTGVLCCANNAMNPCANFSCPMDCCGHGTCDRSFGTCTCDVGWSGDNCCTQCAALDCYSCMNASTCAWCNGSRACTERAAPLCADTIVDNPDACPVYPPAPPAVVTVVNVTQPAAVVTKNVTVIAASAATGAVAFGALIVAAVVLYKKFSSQDYAEFWKETFDAQKDVKKNPLFQDPTKNRDNQLYEPSTH